MGPPIVKSSNKCMYSSNHNLSDDIKYVNMSLDYFIRTDPVKNKLFFGAKIIYLCFVLNIVFTYC